MLVDTDLCHAAVSYAEAELAEIQTIVAEAKAAGSNIKYIVMNLSKFVAFQTSTQVQNWCIASAFIGGTAIRYTPTLAQVNKMMVAQSLLAYVGIQLIRHDIAERYSHAFAGVVIVLTGAFILMTGV